MSSQESTSLTENDENSYKFIFKIILIGDSGTGKTSLINRYIYNNFHEKYLCTIGVDFMMKRVVLDDNTVIKLQIWDTAGMEKYKQITSTYYRGAQGAIVVFDLSSQTSFNSVSKWVNDFKQISNPNYHQTIYIVGNKNDLVDKREVTQEDIDNYCEMNNFAYLETSAKTGEGVEKMFMGFAKELVTKYESNGKGNIPLFQRGNVINLETKGEDNKKSGTCCG